MNKHFLRTLRRVSRDVQELASRGEKQVAGYGPMTPEVALYTALLDANASIRRAAGHADAIGFDEAALSEHQSDPQPDPPAETQQEQQEAQT